MCALSFDHRPPEELNRHWHALFHELGHAVAWYVHGEALGRIRLLAVNTGTVWGGSTACWPRSGNQQCLSKSCYFPIVAERILAGDIAGRKKHGGLDLCAISADGLSRRNNVTRGQIQQELPPNHDLAKAVNLASLAAGNNWLDWLQERQSNALRIVEDNWRSIRPIGDRLIGQVRKNALKQIIFGTDLIAQLRRAKVPTKHMPTIEIIYKDEPQPRLVRLRRFFRSLSEKCVVTHYVDRITP